jgi:hypothetical protein
MSTTFGFGFSHSIDGKQKPSTPFAHKHKRRRRNALQRSARRRQRRQRAGPNACARRDLRPSTAVVGAPRPFGARAAFYGLALLCQGYNPLVSQGPVR